VEISATVSLPSGLVNVWCSSVPPGRLVTLSHYTWIKDPIHRVERQIGHSGSTNWYTKCANLGADGSSFNYEARGEMKTVWRVSSVCSADSSATLQSVCVFCWQFSHSSVGMFVLLTVQSVFSPSEHIRSSDTTLTSKRHTITHWYSLYSTGQLKTNANLSLWMARRHMTTCTHSLGGLTGPRAALDILEKR
jgi:hypothetical protein